MASCTLETGTIDLAPRPLHRARARGGVRLARNERDVGHHDARLEQQRGLQQERRPVPDELQEGAGGHHLRDHHRDEVRRRRPLLQEATHGAHRVLLSPGEHRELAVARGDASPRLARGLEPLLGTDPERRQLLASDREQVGDGVDRRGTEVADEEHEGVRRRDVAGELPDPRGAGRSAGSACAPAGRA